MDNNHNVTDLHKPENPLNELLKQGAQQLLAQAIEAEVQTMLEQFSALQVNGRQGVVRNGYLPERRLQTGLGDIPVKVPKVRDRTGSGIKFNSKLVPPYLKRTKNIEEVVPWLYLRGISTGDMQPALESLLGKEAKGLSANSVSRLKQQWEAEYEQWRKRDLSKRRYVYVWADGVYSKVRMDDKLCLLVVIGVDDTGRKEVLTVVDGYRESEASWLEVLTQLQSQGMTIAPELAIGDGALGFWNAVTKFWPTTRHQRCWVHKTANILNKVPKSVQPRMKESLQDIWMAETRDEAYKAFRLFEQRYGAKYPKATECLVKDKDEMLAFYDFPAEHWTHIRTTNPIESMFATVRLRTNKTKNCGSRKTTLAMAFKLMQTAESNWRRLRGFKLLADVIKGVKFQDGIRETEKSQQDIAL
ncbi:IS256 family transposase [Vibrio cholerae]|uniref:IS256 family transposase n=2 Tax=Vibrio TaxID=662 RepID=UPI001A9FB529|nr:IS256 family transposase [Vibrio cholerae]MBO1365485.1 IS256 family transposase [Vibrio cholerae]MBO1370361.1 IS256 family transposase [Vibrio cholerae]MBO1372511.1 IS256 family transposase [Vibrio cholerae]MBO1376242.1 IS256 family transposase [Vibrio cholerae]MBO1407381.1 IS256 family transposase [Vibrio cholerae]